MKYKKRRTIFLLITLCLITISHTLLAAIVNNPPRPGNNANVLYRSSDIAPNDPNLVYQVYRFTFDVAQQITLQAVSPINPATGTPFPHVFTPAAYNAAAGEVNGAITGAIPFVWETVNTNTFNGNYDHRVIFVQINTNENFYTAAAIGYNNALQPCSNIQNVALDVNGNVTGITLGPAGTGAVINNNCNNQIIDTGLIVFNTFFWDMVFQPGGVRGGGNWNPILNLWTPPLAEQTHWILHEFTHLLGLGHLNNFPNLVGCNSVMIENIANNGCQNAAAPIMYTNHDEDLLRQLGY